MIETRPEKEIASLEVKVGNERSRVILTENFVSMHSKKWFMREAETVIPLGSIDSIFSGWKRYPALLIVGVVLALAGIVMMGLKTGGGGVAVLLGMIMLVAFWFVRPHLLLIRSTREALGGKPISATESQKFIAVVTETLSRTK
jgi:hypothetical protein